MLRLDEKEIVKRLEKLAEKANECCYRSDGYEQNLVQYGKELFGVQEHKEKGYHSKSEMRRIETLKSAKDAENK